MPDDNGFMTDSASIVPDGSVMPGSFGLLSRGGGPADEPMGAGSGSAGAGSASAVPSVPTDASAAGGMTMSVPSGAPTDVAQFSGAPQGVMQEASQEHVQAAMPGEAEVSMPSAPMPSEAAPSVPAPSEVTSSEPMPSEAVTNEPVLTAPVPNEAVPNDPRLNELMNNDGVFGSSLEPGIPAEIAGRINEASNVLVALSSDPSVDEMAAAIGLSLYLDRMGKRATAIYSGATPNALEFLKPEETFEPTVDALQDFVIALNKEKADHLRYKLDGDFVKIYITPYRSRISEEDLEFSYGDYNVDLVLALDVANGVDLDKALREHGRIMHDAVIVNITTGNPGKLGEIEWSDKSASSVSEMIAKLLFGASGGAKLGKEEATAFLTGIVAATNRFSSAGTTPETMRMASRLMESGANQQLIAKNITPDVENEVFRMLDAKGEEKSEVDPTKLNIAHGEGEVDDTKEVSDNVTEKESTLLADLKAAEESLAHAGEETTPESDMEPLKIDSDKTEMPKEDEIKAESMQDDLLPPPPAPPIDLSTVIPGESDLLKSVEVPEEASKSEAVKLPELSGELKPIEPAKPVVEPEPTSLGAQPAMQDQVYRPQVADPSAFKIPGM